MPKSIKVPQHQLKTVVLQLRFGLKLDSLPKMTLNTYKTIAFLTGARPGTVRQSAVNASHRAVSPLILLVSPICAQILVPLTPNYLPYQSC